ncbi:MAG: polyphenol oxidase family protein, partial [Spirochaetaceae bacterium]|nr:polyphenol oxidase family protein [Spirochaetaceae bacterium]
MTQDGMQPHRHEGINWYTWNIFEPWKDRLSVVLTTRSEGVSPFPKNSLNLGRRIEDSEANIRENRQRISSALGLDGYSWIAANQVHGTGIRRATALMSESPGACDAIFLNSTELIAAILLADCLPLILYDPVRHEGMVCHAGWRGTISGMAQAAVGRMVDVGSRREDLIAAVGPGIGPCCYEVGEEVAEIFRKKFGADDGIITDRTDAGGAVIDLEAANLAVFRQSGIPSEHLGRGRVVDHPRAPALALPVVLQ